MVEAAPTGLRWDLSRVLVGRAACTAPPAAGGDGWELPAPQAPGAAGTSSDGLASSSGAARFQEHGAPASAGIEVAADW